MASEVKVMLVERYKQSNQASRTRSRIKEISNNVRTSFVRACSISLPQTSSHIISSTAIEGGTNDQKN